MEEPLFTVRKSTSKKNKFDVFFEGKKLSDSSYEIKRTTGDHEKEIDLNIYDTEIYNQSILSPISRILESNEIYIDSIDFQLDNYLDSELKYLFLDKVTFFRESHVEPILGSHPEDLRNVYEKYFRYAEYAISFLFSVRVDTWNNTWSVEDHVNEALEAFVQINPSFFWLRGQSFSALSNGLYLHFPMISPYHCDGSPLKSYIEECISQFSQVQNQVIERHLYESLSDSLVQKFDFPPEVETACKQYLLYFAEFLHDLGIDSTTSINEADGDTILLVTPQDKDEALTTIAELLKVYLCLPSSPVANSYQNTLASSVEVQKLNAQIQHLNSQLTLANAIAQQQALTIQSQGELIEQQKQFTSQVLLESVKLDKEDGEPLLGGLVTLKNLDWGPLGINLAELYRQLRDRIRKKE